MRKGNSKKRNIIIKLFLSSFIIFITIWFKIYFGDLDLEQITFNLMVSVEGTGKQIIVIFIRDILICLVPLSFFTIYLMKKEINYIPELNVKLFLLKFNIRFNSKFLIWFTNILLIFSIILFTISLNVIKFIKNNIQTSTIYEEYYVNPNNVKIEFPSEKRNLIYIILESMENNYSNHNIDGANVNLIPNLSTIANNNKYFSNNTGFGGCLSAPLTNWTVASLVSQTSGVPLDLPIDGNSYGDNTFLPYITTLGDILNNEGYNQVFMMGSDASFGGRKTYFIEHGNYTIWDYNEAINKNKIDDDYFVWWGYEDGKLFDYAKEELLKLSSDKAPFNFSMLTANTHFFDGYTEESCEKKYNDSYANSIVCSDKQVSEFINWIKQQDFYKKTTIILIGDHLTMNELFINDKNNANERTIYNAFINCPINALNYNNRSFSALDMFPTTLASIGAEIEGNRLGLGTNLFSNEPTLIEKLGEKYLEEEIYKKSEFYNKNFIYGNQTLLTKIKK